MTSNYWYHIDLGRMAYEPVRKLQEQWVSDRYKGILDRDLVLWVEHDPVFTLGRRGGKENLKISEEMLASHHISICQSERGGNITYHGPGQLVVYPIVNLEKLHVNVTEYVTRLEEIMIQVAHDFGIKACRDPKNRGVWVNERKLGSVGVAVRRGITFHGLALNVANDLTPFEWIDPCGLAGVKTTSISRETGSMIDLKDARLSARAHLQTIFNTSLIEPPISMLAQIKKHELSVDQPSSPLPRLKKPSWLTRKLPTGPNFESVRGLISRQGLHTVCQSARCPNIWECFSNKTATFLILGDRCTRNCRFCAVSHGPIEPVDENEPQRVAEAVARLKLKYVVITSVTRDDLPDGGASIFAQTIGEIKKTCAATRIEVLIPDFKADLKAIKTVVQAKPDVINHNIETVSRLYPQVRPQAEYRRSLEVIQTIARLDVQIMTKSGLMVGLGETTEELHQTFADLLSAGCRILTIGQYLQPSLDNLPVIRYVPPEEFTALKKKALDMGFYQVESGPFVRSSYQAHSIYLKSTAS